MNSKTAIFTKWLLDIMFVLGIIVEFTLPLSIKWYEKNIDSGIKNIYIPLIVLFAVCGVLAEMILWQLRLMFKTVINDDCFVEENVISLNKMSHSSYGIALMMAVRCVFLTPTMAALAMVLTFFIAGLFSRVLALVFDKAISYKLENDLTI